MVRRVSRYDSFEKMLDAEGPREVQLAEIRRIYGPEKEALGMAQLGLDVGYVGGE